MKRLFLISLLFIAFTCTNSQATTLGRESLDGVIIIVDMENGKITVNDYMSASYVIVQVLDGNNNVEYTTTASAGATVPFPLTSNTKKVRSSYYLGADSGFIISTDVVNL